MTEQFKPGSPEWEELMAGPFPEECVVWMGGRTGGGGYGAVRVNGNRNPTPVHRIAYEDAVGAIPDGYWIDHLCRNPPCFNPGHLEAVTPGENTRRGSAPRIAGELARQRAAAKTHCKHGHPYTPENVYRAPGTGRRHCKVCARNRSKTGVAA